jgi:hypothetical protein
MRRLFNLMLVSIIAAMLVSCAAVQTSLRYRKLQTSIRMSDTIFLKPGKMEKTVYVEVKNTSTYPLQFADLLKKRLQQKGYTVVDDPDRANYWIQANVLYVGRMKRTAAEEVVARGYGGALTGALIGGAIGANTSGKAAALGAAAGAAAGAIAEDAANTLVGVVNYSGIVDVLISERTRKPIEEVVESNLKQGKQTTVVQRVRRKTNFIQYRTRIAVSATKRNLKFSDAVPALREGLARCIAGIF